MKKILGLNFDDSENDFNKNRQQLQLDLHNNQNYDVDFIIPDCKESIGTKKAFLERHHIQPLGSYGKQKPFNPSKLYYRALPNGEKILRKWISYSSILNKIFCASFLWCFLIEVLMILHLLMVIQLRQKMFIKLLKNMKIQKPTNKQYQLPFNVP